MVGAGIGSVGVDRPDFKIWDVASQSDQNLKGLGLGSHSPHFGNFHHSC